MTSPSKPLKPAPEARKPSQRAEAPKRTLLGLRQDRCPECNGPIGTRPFCPNDGHVYAPFVVSGRYEVLRLLGRGGMAFVFLARHCTLGKYVAVKVLRPEIADEHAERFFQEARTASRVNHENVVSTLDFGHDEDLGLDYFVMEFLRGRALSEVIQTDGPFSLERALPILSQLARALVAAHNVGVLHRDLTPKNVVLTESSGRQDVVKLCDFGVSRSLDLQARLTAAGQVLGTPAYMAPEQIRGDEEGSAACDMYAFGTLAFELLTGHLPVEGRSAVALIAKKLVEHSCRIKERFPNTNLPERLDAAFAACLRVSTSERPTSAEMEVLLSQLDTTPDAELPTNLLGETIGNYQLDSLLGTGSMGSVYLGRNPQIDTRVAVKVLHREVASDRQAVERFVREAQITGSIGSDYIPRYFDFGELPDGRTYAVMEYVEGESLGDLLATQGPFTLARAKSLVVQCATALSKAHAAGVIHRDIKPDNLLVADMGGVEEIRVLDFGIAKTRTRNVKSTLAGTFLGTPVYCAPEQAFGAEPTPQMDVYALACTAFEVLTGHEVFDGKDIEEVMRAKTSGRTPELARRASSLPLPVIRTLEKALAFEPSARHEDLQAFADEVRQWPVSPAGDTGPVHLDETDAADLALGGGGSRNGLGVGVGFGLGVAAIALSVFLVVRGSAPAVDQMEQPHDTSHLREPASLPARGAVEEQAPQHPPSDSVDARDAGTAGEASLAREAPVPQPLPQQDTPLSGESAMVRRAPMRSMRRRPLRETNTARAVPMSTPDAPTRTAMIADPFSE